jgi:ATP-dependent Clp protease ATP-binding subunit ClpA
MLVNEPSVAIANLGSQMIQQQIENPLAKEILSGRFGPKDVIRVDVEGGRIVFEQVIEAEAV